MLRIFICLLLSCCLTVGYAKNTVQPLPPEQAFTFLPSLNKNNELVMEWHIAPGYYLYRDRVKFNLSPASQIQISEVSWPQGIIKKDAHGPSQLYFGVLKIPLRLSANQGLFDVNISYQGCSEHGFCYSPIHKTVKINLSQGPRDLIVTATHAPIVSEQSTAQKILDGKSPFIVILSFLGLGILLAFTPCVLPMIPILSGIIIGHRKRLPTIQTFSLSLSYVLGMAITYAIAGMIVASLGSHIQSQLQAPWVIIIFSGLFILLALSLFGFYELRIPAKWQRSLTALSNRQKGGTYLGVFLMGSISSLIISPCVSPPLVGVLAYIAQTGNIWLGGGALLVLGLGMGVPLLLIGASAGKLLPKAGRWMIVVERIMGVLLLAFAIWLLSRIIPGPIVLFLWALLLIGTAIFMGAFTSGWNERIYLVRGLSLIILIYGIILLVGAFLGNSDPFHPWENWQVGTFQKKQSSNLNYVTVKSVAQLDEALAKAKQENKYVMLDFYADWCESCVRMNRHVFTQPMIQEALSQFMVLRMDVTKNNAFDRLIMDRFHVIAPPTFVFFDLQGKELSAEQAVGEMNTAEFLEHLIKVKEE